ncbi:hypothetical protein OAY09_02920 [Candidatus Pelagibacter sp.]|nr:hypothetical protein [Candidatus Pelagibacter sp.]
MGVKFVARSISSTFSFFITFLTQPPTYLISLFSEKLLIASKILFTGVADKTYIEPITIGVLEKILKKEKPDAILPTMGGQTALNLAMEAEKKGVLKNTK